MKKIIAVKTQVTGEIPTPRFGHTMTMISPDKAVLFGGAVSISGRFVITNQTYLFDFTFMRWKKLNFKQGFIPSQRAAHAAVKVADNQMIIYGGAASGSQGLLKDQLYILDLKKQPTWKIIDVTNKNITPGQRYGHTMVFNKPYLVVFGGNSGNKAQNDVWLLNINRGPFQWQKYEFHNKIAPCPRVYHSAAICQQGSAQGMMVVFGGRKQNKKDPNSSQRDPQVSALNDVWGLRKHRDGTWDWVTPPKYQTYTPLYRYQHLVTFMGSTLVIIGGRSNNPQQAVDQIQVYDTQSSQWTRTSCISRYRHAIALYGKNRLFVHGGFEPQFASQPLQTMVQIDLEKLFNPHANINNMNVNMTKQAKQNNYLLIENSLQSNNSIQQQSVISQRIQTQRKQLRQIGQSQRNMSNNSRIRNNDKLNKSKIDRGQRDLTPSRILNSSKNIRLSNQVVVAKGDYNQIQIQRMNVNELMQQSKKLTSICSQQQSQVHDMSVIQLIQNIISVLMPTQGGQLKNFTLFPFKRDKIIRLCQQTAKILSQQTSLLCARSPAKIFGSLYGRFQDLLYIFENFGYPDDKQMQIVEYIFLGNYVDKGFNSLQTICLLMALKIKYPDHIRLLRGKHQDININRICGFGQECSIRLGQNINDPASMFNAFNTVFDLMPLAVAIQDKYLCVNSGIGSITDIVTLKDINRPVKVRNNQNVIDLLWSEQNGIPQMGYQTKKCSENDLQQFLDKNGLEMIINTKDGLKNGVEDDGPTLSISSIPNYANSLNKGCILKITKELQIAPCLLSANGVKKTPWVNQLNTKINITMTQKQTNFRKNMFQIC